MLLVHGPLISLVVVFRCGTLVCFILIAMHQYCFKRLKQINTNHVSHIQFGIQTWWLINMTPLYVGDTMVDPIKYVAGLSNQIHAHQIFHKKTVTFNFLDSVPCLMLSVLLPLMNQSNYWNQREQWNQRKYVRIRGIA